MTLSPHYLRSAKAASELDRLIVTGLIVGLGITDPTAATLIAARSDIAVRTDAGMLRGHLYTSEKLRSHRAWSPGWMHFRFDDVEAAKRLLPHAHDDRLNGHSGKWNFMFGGDIERNPLLAEYMANELRRLNARDLSFIGKHTGVAQIAWP